MSMSMFLAQVIGLYLTLMSLSMLFHQQRFKKIMQDFLSHQGLLTLSGSVGIIVGLLIVLTHNVWETSWPVLITLVGWFALLQGIARLFLPEAFSKAVRGIMEKQNYLIWCWVWLIVGVYLTWMGFTYMPMMNG